VKKFVVPDWRLNMGRIVVSKEIGHQKLWKLDVFLEEFPVAWKNWKFIWKKWIFMDHKCRFNQAEQAISYGFTGPNLCSWVDYDVRIAQPYSS
jgi:NADH:ubiquinone oxidoreductase subunit D